TSYLWIFEPFSGNASNINPIGKVYDAPGPKFPTLRVTDLYGCYAEDNVSIDVRANPYEGYITATPNPVCQGSPVTLGYMATSGGTSSLISYTWYEQTAPLYTTGTAAYNVFAPGGYWVQGTGSYGCQVRSDNIVGVEVIQVP